MLEHQLPHTEVAIIGAGIGGCLAAIALSSRYKVTLIDKYAQPIARVGECLPPAASRILQKLDLLQEFSQAPHITSLGMQSYWGSEQLQFIDNLANPDGFGWHLYREGFEQQLRQAAQERGVSMLAPMQLADSKALNEHEQGWVLTLSDTQQRFQLTADLVIDATGRHCVFARQRGVSRKQLDKLVSCWMVIDRAPQRMMGLIAPSSNGWWYAAPMATANSTHLKQVLSFQTDVDLLPKALLSNSASLAAQAFLRLVPNFSEFTEIVSGIGVNEYEWHGKVAANSSMLSHAAGQGWFAIGDAALSFDPLSSQGMFNSMATAMQLSDLLLEHGIVSALPQQQYAAQIQRILHYYQQHKSIYYQQETRWAEHSFWRRRAQEL